NESGRQELRKGISEIEGKRQGSEQASAGNERVSKQEICLLGRDQSLLAAARARRNSEITSPLLREGFVGQAPRLPAQRLLLKGNQKQGDRPGCFATRMKVRGGRYHQLPSA